MQEATEHVQRRGRKGTVGVTLLCIMLLGTIGASGFWFVQYRRAISANPDHERSRILKFVGNTVTLPSEQPALSTVVDASKLTNKTLQGLAKTGDKLLVYPKAKRLIIYRPSTKKVVDMLTIKDTQVNTPSATTVSP